MAKSINKLQIRADVLNAVKNLENGQKHTQEFLNKIISPLQEITDKDTILDVLIKEIVSNQNDERFYVLSFLLEQLIPKEKLEGELWKLLTTDNINDSVKSKIINILKDLGNQINYEKYSEYFENPDSVIDADTERLLKNALSNPEVLIDFLDFIEALPYKDREILIDSISEDYTGDELANLFAPVVYANPDSDLSKYAVKRLGESKSDLAVAPLNYVMTYSNDEELKIITKKSLTELKLAGKSNLNREKEFLEEVYKNSQVDDVFVSMPDGRGNIGLIVGRKYLDKDAVSMFSVVLNNTVGIVDCFGFNDITQQEFLRIVNKFYANQEKICIPAYIAKMLLEDAEKLSREKVGKMSYEYVCWRRLLIDVPVLSADLKSILEKRLDKIEITVNDLRKIYSTTILDKWFFFTSDNETFEILIKKIIDILSNETAENTLIKEIECIIMQEKPNIYKDELVSQIDDRLLLSAYLLSLNGFQDYANILNELRFNLEVKEQLLLNILRISVYEFLLREREKYLNTTISTNIFSRRNEANRCFIDKKTLDLAITTLENEWGF